jgi:WD40 repeat protein
MLHRFERRADGRYQEAAPQRLRAQILALDLLPDGSLLIGGSAGFLERWGRDGSRTPFVGHLGDVNTIAWTRLDGEVRIVSGDNAGWLRLWRDDGRLLRELAGHVGNVKSVAFSPDGTRILSGSWDGTARIWLTRTEDLIATAKAEPRAQAEELEGRATQRAR